MKSISSIINFRSCFILAITIMVSITFAFLTFISAPLGWLLMNLLVLTFLVLYFVGTKFDFKREVTLTFLLCMIFGFVAFINFIVTVNSFNGKINSGEVLTASGKVDELVRDKDYIIIKNVHINGERVSGKMRLNIDNEDIFFSLAIGDEVKIETKIYEMKIFNNNQVNASAYRLNIRYTAYPKIHEINITKAQADFFQSIAVSAKSKLNYNLGDRYGNLVYSMLTGNVYELDTRMSSYFSISGLGHVLSVSGLHVGFLCAVIFFVLKKLKLRKLTIFIVCTATLFVYAFAASFSPSVMRAVIMCIVVMVASLALRHKDSLSTLSVSICVILMLFPVYLFEAGFIMSITSIYGIIIFSRPIRIFLKRLRLPKPISSALTVSLSAQLGITPALIFYFNNIQLYSIFANLLVMPIMSVTFIFMFISLILNLLLPHLDFLIRLGGLGVALIDFIAQTIASLPFAVITIYSSIAVLFVYMVYFAISRFIMRPKGSMRIVKNIVCLSLCFLLIFGSIAFRVEFPETKNVVIPINSRYEVTSIIKTDNRNYVIGELSDIFALDDTLQSFNIKKIESIYVYELNEKTASNLVRLSRFYDIKTIICYGHFTIDAIDIFNINKITNFYLNSTNFSDGILPIYYENKLVAYKLNTGKVDLLFINYNSVYSQYSNILNHIEDSAIIRCNEIFPSMPQRIYLTNIDNEHNVGTKVTFGDSRYFYFNYSNGKIHYIY